MRRSTLAAAMLAVSLAASAQATTVLNFNSTRGRGGDTGYVYTDYSEQGYTLTPDECAPNGGACFVTSGSFASSLDPTGAALATQVVPATVTVFKDDGTPFILNSMLMATYSGNIFGSGATTEDVRFTFNYADGTFRIVNYTIQNTAGRNLTSNLLTFDATPLTSFSFIPLGVQIQFDNITLSDVPTPAPEPATWAMMLAGFGLTGSALRRRRRTAAIA